MSAPSSGASTPNPRFKPQAKTAEDILSNQTVGLVNLSDFRKRRAEALEQKERDAQESRLGSSRGGSGAATPAASGSGNSTPPEPLRKKKRKAGTPKLSFDVDDDEDQSEPTSTTPAHKNAATTAAAPLRSQSGSPAPPTNDSAAPKRKFAPNASVGTIPKALTKRSLLQESQAREALRKEFLVLQERVKASAIAIPFVFYDGTNVPGGVCRVLKGDFVWKFLDGSRKVGAEVGAGVGGGEGAKGDAKARREWAKVGVDDLMMVRGEIIIPPHYDFYYFIINKTLGPNQRLLFDYSSQPPPSDTPSTPHSATVDDAIPENYNPLSRPTNPKSAGAMTPIADLDGADDDPTFTKVVDRRWYERNKHIYPASVWQEFDPEKDYQKEVKRDVGGNAFFFS